MNHSTKPMTAVERAYVEACKTGPCVPCIAWERSPQSNPFFVGAWGGDFHHYTSGGRRISHLHGICACAWHHRGHPAGGLSAASTRAMYGPSLMDGSKVFHSAYGSDAELLALQDEILRERGIEPPVRPENRRWAA